MEMIKTLGLLNKFKKDDMLLTIVLPVVFWLWAKEVVHEGGRQSLSSLLHVDSRKVTSLCMCLASMTHMTAHLDAEQHNQHRVQNGLLRGQDSYRTLKLGGN